MTSQYAQARLASTILVVRDDPFEVLMVRRHEKQVFSSALVFPGGTVDAADHSEDWLDLLEGHEGLDPCQRALRIAGFRETFEETGILLARGTDGNWVSGPTGANAPFIDAVQTSGGRLNLADLTHFGHWITPVQAPKRFDTHFFLCRAAREHEAICDGSEAVALEWAAPADILARAAVGERSILFPTRMNVLLLARSNSVDEAIEAARKRPVFSVLPHVEQRDDGTLVTIPAEAGYGETENFVPRKA